MPKILYVTSEVYPFIKTGGLADVSYALPKELNNNGFETRVICPLYETIPDEFKKKMKKVSEFTVPVGWRKQYCGLFECTSGNTVFYFTDNEFYFKRGGAYGYYDDGERFSFFSRAIPEAILNIDFKPDILHLNDWHTGMIPVIIKNFYKNTKADLKTLYSIHNLKFQGTFPQSVLTELLGLDYLYYSEDKLKFYDGISFMKGGIIYSDFVNTVSPSYALEIQNDFFGEGLNGVLQEYNYKLKGILNGIDYSLYDPKTDKTIFKNYNSVKTDIKYENKIMLQKEMGLYEDKDVPLIGIISRLTPQKGFDLVTAMMEEILNLGVQMIILGTGNKKYEDIFNYYQKRYPERVSTNITFSDTLARKIYAASDLFLMPSLFEPCGLGQIMALRYGSLPIVRETGGLKDTISPYNEFKNTGNGFSFTNFNAHDMKNVIKYAVNIYKKDKENWNKLVKRAMRCNFSWENSAKEYMKIYNQLLKEEV